MTWVKICGLTTEAGVEAAITAGADAIGFVFAPSKRRVSAEQAVKLARDIPQNILRVAVMLHPQQRLVDEVCAVFLPDVLQTDFADLSSLCIPTGVTVMPVIRGDACIPSLAERGSIPRDVTVMPVIRGDACVPSLAERGRDREGALQVTAAAIPPRVLFEGAISGSGRTADWNTAACYSRTTQLVLAGGLNAENIAAAIAAVQPFGVDVSSGVEAAPGVKDPGKIHEFVRRARAANGAR